MEQCQNAAVDNTAKELCRVCCYQDGSEDTRPRGGRERQYDRENLFPYQLETLIEPLFWRTQ